jgi:hypothetical protein
MYCDVKINTSRGGPRSWQQLGFWGVWGGGTGHSQFYFILPVSLVFITIYVISDEDFRLRKYYFGFTGICWGFL